MNDLIAVNHGDGNARKPTVVHRGLDKASISAKSGLADWATARPVLLASSPSVRRRPRAVGPVDHGTQSPPLRVAGT